MKAIQSSLCCLLLACISPTGFSQSAIFTSEAVTIPWPENIPNLPKGRMVTGEVTGDGLPDAVVINGNKPMVVYGPAYYQSIFEIDVIANDIAILEGATPAAEDTLVVAGPDGIRLYSIYSAGSYTSTLVEPTAAPSWADAARVQVTDFNYDGRPDLAGLSAGGDILTLAGGLLLNPVETVLPMVATVLDYAVIDWEGAPQKSIAVLRTDGFFVYDLGGAPLYSIPIGKGLALDDGMLGVFRQANYAYDRLVMVYGIAGAQVMLVIDSQVPLDPDDLPVSMPVGNFYALSIADADLDGNEDLYLVHRTTHQTLLVLNQSDVPGKPTFKFGEEGEVVDLCPGSATRTWSAWPTMADYSADADPDLLLFVEACDAFVYVENTTRLTSDSQAFVNSGTYIFDENLDKGLLTLKLELPQAIPFTPTHVQVIGWIQTDAAGGQIEVDHDAVVQERFAISNVLTSTLSLHLQEAELYTPNIYHFDIRAVRVGDKVEQEIGSPSIHAFTTPISLVTGLEDGFGPGTPLRVLLIPDTSPFWNGPGHLGGTFELSPDDLIERMLSPKEVEIDKVPLICFPPNPLG